MRVDEEDRRHEAVEEEEEARGLRAFSHQWA